MRLAVLLNRSRSKQELPAIGLSIDGDRLHLAFPPEWLERNPLSIADLEQEARYLKSGNIELSVGPL